MKTSTSTSTSYTRKYSPSTMLRSPVTIFLIAIGLLAFFYQVLSTFPAITTNLRTTIQHALPATSYCTKEIGQGVCCDLFVAAEPCVEECRKQNTDRQTFQLTQEFDACSAQCLTSYTTQCSDDAAREGAAGETLAGA